MDKAKQSREEGARVWESLLTQLMEAGGFFGGMFRSFKAFVKRYFWSLLLMGFIAAIAGGAYWWSQPAVYKADMTVSYVHYEKKIYADMLAKLNSLLQSGETEQLSTLLSLSEDEIKNINYINSYNIRKKPLVEDMSTEKLPFYIELGIKGPEGLSSLQKALVDYLNNTEFIQSRLNYMYKKAEEELEFLERKLAVADSLSKLYIIRNEGMNDEKTITRMELLEESLAIYARMQEVRGLQTFNRNIEVLDGFVALQARGGMSLIAYLMYGFLLGIALRLLFLLFR